MSQGPIIIRGEAYLTLEIVADCYRVEVGWIREVYEVGLLGPGERVGSSVAIAASMLDRLGRILRMHRQQGLDLTGILVLLREGGEFPRPR